MPPAFFSPILAAREGPRQYRQHESRRAVGQGFPEDGDEGQDADRAHFRVPERIEKKEKLDEGATCDRVGFCRVSLRNVLRREGGKPFLEIAFPDFLVENAKSPFFPVHRDDRYRSSLPDRADRFPVEPFELAGLTEQRKAGFRRYYRVFGLPGVFFRADGIGLNDEFAVRKTRADTGYAAFLFHEHEASRVAPFRDEAGRFRHDDVHDEGHGADQRYTAWHVWPFRGIVIGMNITRLVTGPLAVNTWIVPFEEASPSAEGKCVVVDPGGDADVIIAHLAERRSIPALVVLTHGHFDHIGALPDLVREYPGLKVAMHPDDAYFLGEGAVERHASFFAQAGGLSIVRRFQGVLPAASVSLGEGLSLSSILGPGSGDWIVWHTPGHSAGSVCLYSAAEKTLVSGDTLFNAGFGRTDLPGGDLSALEASLTRLMALPPETVVLPGHGEPTTIGAEFC